jgi:hypothetical protein
LIAAGAVAILVGLTLELRFGRSAPARGVVLDELG